MVDDLDQGRTSFRERHWADALARLRRADAAADLALDVAVLGAGFLGHGTGGLLRAGLVREHRPGAYGELVRAMRTLVAPEPSIGF